jgi:hypothetical protein
MSTMTQVFCKTSIDIPADAIWQAISDFGVAGRYLSGVISCAAAGKGVGTVRTLTSADSSTIVERLETLNGVARRLSYALLTDTPFRNCLTTMAVHHLGPNRAELEWGATFEPDGLPESEAVALLESAMAANCLALKQVLERHGMPRGRPDPS